MSASACPTAFAHATVMRIIDAAVIDNERTTRDKEVADDAREAARAILVVLKKLQATIVKDAQRHHATCGACGENLRIGAVFEGT